MDLQEHSLHKVTYYLRRFTNIFTHYYLLLRDVTAAQNIEPKEEIDIDLNDPEVNAAAVKIQAGFKGFKIRKELAASKESSAVPSSERLPSPVDYQPKHAPKQQDDEPSDES